MDKTSAPATKKTETIRLRDLFLRLEQCDDPLPLLRRRVADRLGVPLDAVGAPRIVRRALDSRRQPPRYVYAVDVELAPKLAEHAALSGKAERPKPIERYAWRLPNPVDGPPPVVVGAGPAGLFAALTLAQAGWPPVVIERGQQVAARAKSVSKLYRDGVLNQESNVCYGEGGAGAFSDGKLYTRVGDTRVAHVLETLVGLGSDPDILIDNRPHLGTDRLVDLLVRMRERLESHGATLRFNTRVSDFELKDSQIRGVRLAGGERLSAAAVILSTGHSAREVWERLAAAGLPLEARPFAIGLRIEHPQALINQIRYGRSGRLQGQKKHITLPAADYRLTYNEPKGKRRGVYSFCMCPGGVVVPTPTRDEELCINGMSHAARSGRFANSALVVTVDPDDFAEAGHSGIFAGVTFVQQIEQRAYAMGGGAFVAPAARATDFVAGVPSQTVGQTSYRRGLCSANLTDLLPAAVAGALKQALRAFDRRMRGFVSAEATLIGVETRTASPIRLPRDAGLQAVGARGLYPAGEGMGYGGGIVSAAVDGVRAAEALLEHVGAVREIVR